MKVLVVDDVASNRLVLTALLERSGYEVLSAGTVGEALCAVRDERPDVVLTDLNMPSSGEGVSLARAIRQMPLGRDVRLALMTGDAVSLSKGDDLLFEAVLDKPVSACDLVAFLEGSR